MTTALETTEARREVEPHEVDRLTHSFTDSPLQPFTTEAEKMQAIALCERLELPANSGQVRKRVVALLSQYFVASGSTELISLQSDDWLEELRGLPFWAIDRAAKWWIGRDNPNRGKKPMPGDISERAIKEQQVTRIMRWRAEKAIEAAKKEQAASVAELTPAELEQRRKAAAEIMANLNIGGAK